MNKEILVWGIISYQTQTACNNHMLILCRHTLGLGDTADVYDPGRAQMSSEDPNPWPPALVGEGCRGAPGATEWWILLSWKSDDKGQGHEVGGQSHWALR